MIGALALVGCTQDVRSGVGLDDGTIKIFYDVCAPRVVKRMILRVQGRDIAELNIDDIASATSEVALYPADRRYALTGDLPELIGTIGAFGFDEELVSLHGTVFDVSELREGLIKRGTGYESISDWRESMARKCGLKRPAIRGG